jgi:hypothetical protein
MYRHYSPDGKRLPWTGFEQLATDFSIVPDLCTVMQLRELFDVRTVDSVSASKRIRELRTDSFPLSLSLSLSPSMTSPAREFFRGKRWTQ